MALVYKVNKAHNNILGKNLTPDEIAAKVAELFLGNPEKHIEPHNITSIGRVIGYTSRDSVYRFMNRAAELGLLQKKGKQFVKPETSPENEFKAFSKEHPIINDPIVTEWYEGLQAKNHGEGIAIAPALLTRIETICNTCHVTPSQLISSKANAVEIKKNFLKAYREHRVISKRNMTYKAEIANIDYSYSYAIASICQKFGVSWERGTAEMSRKVVGHAKYGDIRLTDEELEKADNYIKEKFGIDSNLHRTFWIGVETCARHEALFEMELDYTKHTSPRTNKTTYYMTAYESKTKHIKGGKMTKYIKRADTQKSIDFLKERGGTKIYEITDLSKVKTIEQIKFQMLDLYIFLGKITNIGDLYEKRKQGHKKTGNYWFDHWLHALRHVGAHYHLFKTKYNYGYVAVLGGWHTIDELKKSYGEMPPEVLDSLLEEFDY